MFISSKFNCSVLVQDLSKYYTVVKSITLVCLTWFSVNIFRSYTKTVSRIKRENIFPLFSKVKLTIEDDKASLRKFCNSGESSVLLFRKAHLVSCTQCPVYKEKG